MFLSFGDMMPEDGFDCNRPTYDFPLPKSSKWSARVIGKYAKRLGMTVEDFRWLLRWWRVDNLKIATGSMMKMVSDTSYAHNPLLDIVRGGAR